MAQQIDLTDSAVARNAKATSGLRVPPHDLSAEESLLGAMLLSKEAIAVAIEHLDVDAFYKPTHSHIFDAICSLYGASQPADPITVADELRRAGLLDAVGGTQALINIQSNTPAITNAARYARIVSDHAVLRRLIGVAGEIAEMGYSLPDDVEETIDRAETMVFEIADRRARDTLRPLTDLLEPTLDRLEMLYSQDMSVTGIPTGFRDLDNLLAGLQPDNLVVIGARPAIGKTAFALGISLQAALTSKRPVLFFSLEMSHVELTQRLLSSEAKVDGERMRVGKLHESDWGKISHAIGRLSQAPLYLDDNAHVTVMDIRAKARRLKAQLGDLGLIVIDYMQLMTGRHGAESRQLEVSEMSRGLKILARELKVPVVALSQLSRRLEDRADKRPMLSDLRESGCLTPDTRIARADTGAWVTMGELFEANARDVPVWTLDPDGRFVVGTMTHVFSSGIKDTFRLTLESGRSVKASANHPFLTANGWRALGDLEPNDHVAVPVELPRPLRTRTWAEHEIVLLAHLLGSSGLGPCSFDADGLSRCDSLHYPSDDAQNLNDVEAAIRAFGVHPRRVWRQSGWNITVAPVHELRNESAHPIVQWLRSLDVEPLAHHGTQSVPDAVFSMPSRQVSLFLHHLSRTDATRQVLRSHPNACWAAPTAVLAADLQRLALRVGQPTRIVEYVNDADTQCWVVEAVGPIVLDANASDSQSDVRGVHFAPRRGAQPTAVPATPVSILAGGSGRTGVAVREHELTATAAEPGISAARAGAVLLERIVSIEPLGPTEVFDATVLGTHNFVADGVVVHNSIEQDADVVMFLYRDEVYNPDSPDKGMAEVLVAKHRNGPTGHVKLAFLQHNARFADMARSSE
jgi:replicative DNA helicase